MTTLKVIGTAAIAVIAWLAFVGYSALGGLWMNPVAAEGDSEAFSDYALHRLRENNPGAASLLMIEGGLIVNEFHKGLVDNIKWSRDWVALERFLRWPYYSASAAGV